MLVTGEKLRLKDAYTDPRFDPSIDSRWNKKTKSIIMLPLSDNQNNIIGCIRIARGQNLATFDECDQKLFEEFCKFYSLSINEKIMQRELEKCQIDKEITSEILTYHSNCSRNELQAFMNTISDEYSLNRLLYERSFLNNYEYDDFALNNNQMVLASFSIFNHCGFIEAFGIKKEVNFYCFNSCLYNV